MRYRDAMAQRCIRINVRYNSKDETNCDVHMNNNNNNNITIIILIS